ncbi:MAG: hypothetical protein LBR80_04700 [Deltaproteobacteria bacterium]|jgi:hypothetical protein|nr:hypothetical protein [Deltaproteobacteria bacterium]
MELKKYREKAKSFSAVQISKENIGDVLLFLMEQNNNRIDLCFGDRNHHLGIELGSWLVDRDGQGTKIEKRFEVVRDQEFREVNEEVK